MISAVVKDILVVYYCTKFNKNQLELNIQRQFVLKSIIYSLSALMEDIPQIFMNSSHKLWLVSYDS